MVKYSISYLEPKNITSLNLFTYCNNNPVMYVDENGIGSVMVSIGISFAIGEVTSLLSDYICNKIQINRLTSNPNLNKKELNKLGINFSFNKNGKSIASFSNAIKTGKWMSKTLSNYLSTNVTSNISSLLIGLL